MVKHTATPSEILRERWYPVATSASLGAKPLGVQRLGQKMVLWRAPDGRAVAQHARCPHRGADLSLGRVVGGQLECPYHGFRFGQDGACTLMPCEGPDAKIRKDMCTPAWITREEHGLVWVWWGDGEPGELPWIEGVDALGAYCLHRAFCWDVSLSRLVEGMTDVHHVPFAHRRYIRGVGAMVDPFEAHIEGDIVRAHGVLRDHAQDPAQGWPFKVAARLPGVVRLGFAGVEILIVMTPVSETRTWGVVLYEQHQLRVPIIGQLWGRFLLWTEFAFIQPDDERMLLASQPLHAAPRDACYVRADAVAALWYRLRAEALASEA
jgi:nitrite reductase/ring-hydroxylating ferredoxin subunit